MAATDFEKLVVQLSADLRGYENAMRKAVGVTNSRAREIEKRYQRMNASISSAVSAPLAGLGAALSVREITRYADAWTQAGNMIAAAAQGSGVQVRSLELLREGADDARTSLESYANLYASLIRAASGVAKSEEEIATATNLVSKAMQAGGASIAEQQSAILQLGQALGSGVLQGDELRSLRENAPIIAQAIATEFGVAIGQLKKLGEEGKLTSDRVFQAIIKAQPQIQAQFEKTNQTIAGGFVKLGNALTEYVGKMAEATGLTSAINSILAAVAGNMESVAAAAAAAAAVLLATYVPALTRAAAAGAVMLATNPFLAMAAAIGGAAFALSAFGDEIQPVQGELATLQDYAGAAWDEISSGVGAASSAISSAFLDAINAISGAIGGLPVTWADVGATITGIVNTWIGVHVAAFETIKTIFTQLPGAVAEGIIGAINMVIEKIETMVRLAIQGVNAAIAAVNNLPGLDLSSINPTVYLGRVENGFRGAGSKIGSALSDGISGALAKDYLGDAANSIRDDANLNAFKNKISAAIDSAGPTSTAGFGGGSGVPSSAAGGSGGGGRKGRQRKDELEKEIESIKKHTAALVAETAAQAGLNPLLDDYGYAVAKAASMQDLLTAAQEAGKTVTPELRSQIEQLAEAYAQAEVAANQMDEQQQKIKDRADDMQRFREQTTRGLVQDLLEGKSAADAFASALGKVGGKLLDLAFNDMFGKGGAFGGGGGLGGLLGSLFGGFRAGGGPVSPGKGYVVGENGPEWFAPKSAGTILPNVPRAAAVTSGGNTVSMVIDVRGATGNQEVMGMVAAGVSQGMAQVRREVPGLVTKFNSRGA